MKPVEQFLEDLPAANTRAGYRSAIKNFLSYIHNDEHDRSDFPYWFALADRYVVSKDAEQAYNDLKRYLIAREKMSPTTRKTMKASITSWFTAQGWEPGKDVKKVLQGKCKGGVRTMDRIPKVSELQTILSHAKQPINTIILILLSSGMRINELLSVMWDDVDLAADPCRIRVRGEHTKNGQGRITFCSKEAAEALRQWKDYYPQYVIARQNHIRRGFPDPKNRVFPMDDAGVRLAYQKVLVKAGCGKKDSSTGWLELHIHVYRKFFRSVLSKAPRTDSRDYVEKLMGHDGYLSNSYVRMDPEELAAFYQENEQLLWIRQPWTVKSPEMDAKIHEQDARIKALEEENKDLRSKVDLLDFLDKNRAKIEQLKALIQS